MSDGARPSSSRVVLVVLEQSKYKYVVVYTWKTSRVRKSRGRYGRVYYYYYYSVRPQSAAAAAPIAVTSLLKRTTTPYTRVISRV